MIQTLSAAFGGKPVSVLEQLYPIAEAERIDPREVVDDIAKRAGLTKE